MVKGGAGCAALVHKREGKRMRQEEKEFKWMLICACVFMGAFTLFATIGIMALFIRFVG
jgi:hypothetical protein